MATRGIARRRQMGMLDVSEEVRRAQREGVGVVALESTLGCHGFPKPDGARVAAALEEAVRLQGAVPATVAVVAGRLRVGLGREELEELASREDVRKCSERDLPAACAEGAWGATTVAATCAAAALAGVEVFATGGIGGVHRGWQGSLDISADLDALARRPVVVVSAGAKALLDLPATLEVLETRGVPVVGFCTDDFPAFYCRRSGGRVGARADDVVALSRLWRNARALGWPGGMLVCNPLPARAEIAREEVEGWIEEALRAAERRGIRGPAVTPFALEAMRRASGGRTLEANRALAVSNAGLAARLAVQLATPLGAGRWG